VGVHTHQPLHTGPATALLSRASVANDVALTTPPQLLTSRSQ